MLTELMHFRGTWRAYQQRVLDHYDIYSRDNKFHIVAAPGSGKTTLGIELIRRIDRPALILAPSITIREQWVDRITEAFLIDPSAGEQYLSQDLKNPKLITVATYQALHSAMTRYKGKLTDSDDEDSRTEEVDFEGFDIIETFRSVNLGTLCLDECHHLRSEWWKALEEFKPHFENIFTVSLTATPPYDSESGMWERYMDMCGDIDEEITIPELVKEGNLCPHQDYIYFNYPTDPEKERMKEFEINAQKIYEEIVDDPTFYNAVRSHRFFTGTAGAEELLENPSYLSSMIIFLDHHDDIHANRYQELLGYKKLEPMSVKWLEILLQGFLYDDVDSFAVDKVYRENLIKELKSFDFIERRKVVLTMNKAVEKMLTNSVGKCESIKDIVRHEYGNMGSSLRMLILTDYIKKEYEAALGDENRETASLGVLPFFEQIRRDNLRDNPNLRLGVLCGTIVIIPAEAKEELLSMAEEPEKISFHRAGKLTDYVKVEVKGDSHFLTGLVSGLFAKGFFQILIGTKSLLGEGWDSPCINSLILASFVGSYMLSNQMRGRAIRVFREDPDKTSNIWHLVCVKPRESMSDTYDRGESEDFLTLSRRTEHFLGLHYEKDEIESGMDRMTAVKMPFTPANVKKTNKKMLELSSERHLLKERWDRSLAVYDEIEVATETDVPDRIISSVLFRDALRTFYLMLAAVILGGLITLLIVSRGGSFRVLKTAVIFIYLMPALISVFVVSKKLHKFRNPVARLQVFGEAVRSALISTGKMESEHSAVRTEELPPLYAVSLQGGTGHDKTLFAQCVNEFYNEIDNQRYILYNEKRKNNLDGYFVVPSCFSRKKEDAVMFAECVRPYIGNYTAVYTRSAEGRKVLLEGRIHALANRENRCITKKKVKGALE